jgi:hypothetical protein
VGRKQTNGERPLLRHLENVFAESGHQVPGLMRDIATSEAFRTATAPASDTAARENTPADTANNVINSADNPNRSEAT